MCPHCGFSLENLDKKYGKDAIPYRRVCDNAGALRQQDRMRLNALLEKLERRIPPVLLSVYFPNILEPFSLIPHINGLIEWAFENREAIMNDRKKTSRA